MKLNTITLTQFGPFEDRTVAFRPGLNLVFGYNEAGKSTLLRAIRAAFYGASSTKLGGKNVRTLDGWNGSRAKTRLTVSAELDDKRSIVFDRTNSTKTPVEGTLGNVPLTVDSLTQVLGIDTTQYRHVFGFTLAELREGQQSLVDANVTEVLFGGGLGRLAQFRKLQKQIEKLSGELFKARGKNQPINAKLAVVQQLERKLRDATVTPQEYRDTNEAIAALQRESDALESDVTSLRNELTRIDRLQQIAPLATELAEIRAAQEALDLELPLSEEEVLVATESLSELAGLGEQLDRLAHQIGQLEAERAQLTLHPELEELATVIESLHADSAHVANLRSELPDLIDQLAALETKVESGTGGEDLPKDAAARCDDWRTRSETLVNRKQEAATDHSIAKRNLAELNATLEASFDREHELAVLACAERWTERDREKDRRESLANEVELRKKKLANKQARIIHEVDWRAWPDNLDGLPTREEVSKLIERWQIVREEWKLARETQASIEKQLQRVRDNLETLRSDPGAVPISELIDVRSERDKLLNHLIGHVGDQSTEESVGELRDLSGYVVEADELADRMRANAQTAARDAQLSAELGHLLRDLDAAKQSVEASEVKSDEWNGAWNQLWKTANVESSPQPTTAEVWMAEVQALDGEATDLRALESELRRLAEELANTEEDLSKLLPDNLRDSSIGVCRSWLTAETEIVRDRQSQRRRANQQRPAAEIACHEAEELLASIDAELKSIDTEFATWRDDHKQSSELTLDALQHLLNVQEHETKLRDQQAALANRIRSHERTVSRFDQQLELLAGITVDSESQEQQVANAARMLNAHRDAVILDSSLQKQIASASADHNRLCEEHQRHQASIDSIRQLRSTHSSKTDGESDAEFRITLNKSATYWELAASIRELKGKLALVCGDEPFETAVEELNKTSAGERADRRDELEATAKSVKQKLGEIRDKLAVMRGNQSSLAATDRLGELQAELESERADLRNAVDQYAPLVLLKAMLERAVQRFGASVRPDLLEAVARLFSELTDGAYVDVDRCLEADELRVQAADKSWKSPAELSTGTRELLYLAVRLAFVREHVAAHESMPVLLDDVLVNIDARRTVSVIRTLSDLAEHIQIIVLTCRPELAMLFENLGHEDSIVEIQPGQLIASHHLLGHVGATRPDSGQADTFNTSPGTDTADDIKQSNERLLFES